MQAGNKEKWIDYRQTSCPERARKFCTDHLSYVGLRKKKKKKKKSIPYLKQFVLISESWSIEWNETENKYNRAKVYNHAKMSNHFYAAQLNCASKLTFYTIV